MDDPSSRSRYFILNSYVGGHSYFFLFLLGLSALIAYWFILPFFSFVFGTGVFSVVITGLTVFGLVIPFRKKILKHLFGKAPDEGEAVLIEYFSQQNHHSGSAQEEDVAAELIENALHLQEVSAAACMTPKEQIVYVPVSTDLSTVQQLFSNTQLSRILVTSDERLDHILGYIHVQQIFEQPESIRKMIMPIPFVPAGIPVNELLSRFVKTRTNIACVSDGTGRRAGMIAFEDVLEELFGEIEDEFD